MLLLRHQVSDMTPIVRHLLRHQALVDALICIMATIHIIQPVMFTIGNSVIDFIICQCWHRYKFVNFLREINNKFPIFFSQAIYWATIFVSVYNLVLIAYERFLAICRPLRHEVFNEKQLKIILAMVYLYSFTLGQAGSYFQVSANLRTFYICIFLRMIDYVF